VAAGFDEAREHERGVENLIDTPLLPFSSASRATERGSLCVLLARHDDAAAEPLAVEAPLARSALTER
jgi:hypothetical protein